MIREKTSTLNTETIEVKIAGNPYFTANCYLVSLLTDSDSVIVIDPGDEPDLILSKIAGRPVLAIICTHGHLDHVGALQQVAEASGAKVYAHAGDEMWLEEFRASFGSKAEQNQDLPQEKRLEAPGYLMDGETLEYGDLSLTVLHTPGHSQGSICLYCAEQGVLFSGDTLFKFTCGRTDLPGGNPSDMHDSLAYLSTLPPETIVFPGHEATTTIGAELHRGLSEY